MVRQDIHAQSTKDHIQPENAQTRGDGQTGHLYSINKGPYTSWKCTNEERWSDRSFMLNQQKVTYTLEMHKQGEMVRQVIYAQSTKDHIQPENAQPRGDGQTGHSCSINKRSHTAWRCTNGERWSNRVIHTQSAKGHLHTGIAQTRQDGQTDHSCSIKKRSHTVCKCTNKARWSDRSSMLNQRKVTYRLEMCKPGEVVRQIICGQPHTA